MTDITTQEEFQSTMAELLDRWCEQRMLRPLAVLLPGYFAFNGMTDGWHEIRASLRRLLALGPDSFSLADWSLVHDLIRATDRAIHRS
jgi:hypothetical protein